jgi:hypothetical protein
LFALFSVFCVLKDLGPFIAGILLHSPGAV